jgi:hypothetical protein
MITAFYDFACSPASYDFIVFAAHVRALANKTPVHVVFVPATNDGGWLEDHKPTTPEQRDWRRDNLVVPICGLFGFSYTVCRSRDEAIAYHKRADKVFPGGYAVSAPKRGYWLPDLTATWRRGGRWSFRASDEARRYVKQSAGEGYITLTHRRTHTDGRNSSKSWPWFGMWLTEQGHKVIRIPDTEDAASHGGPGALAAISPDLRLALYESALVNIGVNTGPMGLCTYGTSPYIMVKMVADWVATTPAFFERIGLPVGSQFPWATEKQTLVWMDDDDKTLMNAWTSWQERHRAVA